MAVTQCVSIGGRTIGPGHSCYLIAEVGTTCLGNMNYALELITAAAKAGMDAVKFQMIDPEQLSDEKAEYKYSAGGKEHSSNLKKMFQKLTFSSEEWKELQLACHNIGLEFFATVDYLGGVDLLDELGVKVHKMGAWDVTYRPLVEKIAATGKPMFMDLGPATEEEMGDFIGWFREAGGDVVMFMHDFHTQDETQMNMRAISYVAEKYPWPAGFSSPARYDDLDILALALGACHIEKRLILDRSLLAFHADESLEPQELKQWVARIRRAEKALGQCAINPSDADRDQTSLYYRSICTTQSMRAGEILGLNNLDGKRPGTGISCAHLAELQGRQVTRDLNVNTLITEDDYA